MLTDKQKDQLICAEVIQHQMRRDGTIPTNTVLDNIALVAGDTVTLETAEGHVTTTVEARHLEAVAAFRANYGGAWYPGINLRIEPTA